LIKKSAWVDRGFRYISFAGSITTVIVLSIYAYGGIFSRPLADDYCESVWLYSSANTLEATIRAYNTWLARFSKLGFVQLVEVGGVHGFQAMSGIMIVLWLTGLTWLLMEIARVCSITLRPIVYVWLAGLGIFISFYQAPILYQILYWRAGLPYALPLPFFVIMAAFMLWYARQPVRVLPAVWAGMLCSVWAFLSSGFGETTAALLIGALVGFLLITLVSHRFHQRSDIEMVLAMALLGAVLALLVMAIAPGTSHRLDVIKGEPPVYNPLVLGTQVLTYTFQFLWDTLKVTPLTLAVAISIPFGLMFVRSSETDSIRYSNLKILSVIFILFVLMVIAIGFSFAPSAFVHTYPVPRARFAAHFALNLTLLLIGGMLGVLARRIKFPVEINLVMNVVLVILSVTSLYPLYVSSKLRAPLTEYQAFAAAWDERDAYIRAATASGATSVIVQQFNPMGGVGELKDNPENWINKCAAQYYGLDSIAAP